MPLNPIEKARAIELLRNGCTREEVCRRLGITKSIVSAIARRIPADAESADSIRAEEGTRLDRQLAAHNAQKRRHRGEGYSDPGPWQENAIRIMEDMQ